MDVQPRAAGTDRRAALIEPMFKPAVCRQHPAEKDWGYPWCGRIDDEKLGPTDVSDK
jgi:hypothetical protein